MSTARLEESLRRALEQAAPQPTPAQVAAARERLRTRIARRRAYGRGGAAVAGLVAAVALVLAVLVAPWQGPAPDPVPPGASAAPTTVPGTTLPAALQGTWTATVAREGETVVATLELAGRTYQLCAGAGACLTGEVVRQGADLVFHSELWCPATGPAGAGRYAWTLHGKTLRLTGIGTDPCYRAPMLGDAAWARA